MMSCFGTRLHGKKSKAPEPPDEDEEYRVYRNKMQSEHRIAFLPSLRELMGFVTNRERHCDVEEICKGDLKRLDRVRYFKFVTSLYPDVTFTIDTRRGKVQLRGRGKSFEDAFDMCFRQMRDTNVVERNLDLNLKDKWKWDIVANMRCQQYLGDKLRANDIMAEIKAGNSIDFIIVTALNEVEWQKAKKILDESLIKEVLPYPNGVDIEGSQFHHFKTEQEKNKPLKITFGRSDEMPIIQFVGVKDNVVEAIRATEVFFELQQEKEHEFTLELSKAKLIFLRRHFSQLSKPIGDNLKVHIKIGTEPEKCIFCWKGLPNTYDKCVAFLKELCASISEENRTIELPGLGQLFMINTDGEKMLELLQEAKMVYIHHDISTRDRLISDSAVQRSSIDEEPIQKEAVVVKTDGLEDLMISLKHGCIENERADVLAYFALQNLNDRGTTSCEALKQAGGTTYTEECKPYTNISHGDIACTTGGNLACHYVIHAVGCDMKVSKEKNEKVARILVNKCLQKCIDLRVASLAMSSFIADENGAKEFFGMVYEEIKRLNASSEGEFPLRYIRIVHPKKKLEKEKTVPRLRRTRHSSSPQHTKSTYCYGRKFKSGNVVLSEGELSTFEADAIINILPNHLHFPSDNSVCDMILLAAGSAVQDELRRRTRNSTRTYPGSIFTTSAGLIRNVRSILHIIPASTDDPGLQFSLEQCLEFVKSLSFGNVLFPIAATMSLEVTLRQFLNLILIAAENCNLYDSVPLEIVVLVERKSDFDDLKPLLKEAMVTANDGYVPDPSHHHSSDDEFTKVSHVNEEVAYVSQLETPTATIMSLRDQKRTAGKNDKEAQISIPATKRDEDRILLRFVGLQPAVQDAISEVGNFIERNKAAEVIEISTDGLQFRQERLKDLGRLSSIYHVLILLQSSKIKVEGIKNNVRECQNEIIRLLDKYEKNEDAIIQPLEDANKNNEHVFNEGRSNVSNDATITNFPKDRLDSKLSASWLWKSKSEAHREKFKKLIEYGQEHPDEIQEIQGVRFSCLEEFCIGHGSDGTSVYIGLGKDGYEKAVKCLLKNRCAILAKHEKEILNETSAATSKHTVKYWFFDDQSNTLFAYLILDLYEESLEEYVERNDPEHLIKYAPDIIRQILEGLNDIHQKPKPILHRDLNPSNIMRNVQDMWLLSDFGISRILPKNKKIHVSTPRGNEHWRAAESHHMEGASTESNVQYQKESDIQIAGMVSYFIVTKGDHAFGDDAQIVHNILNGNPVGLKVINDPALEDLLAWMLSHNPEERPSAKEALKHPYLQNIDEQIELLCTVGNHSKIKDGDSACDIVRKINSDTTIGKWKASIDPDVFNYLCLDPKKSTPNTYGKQLTDCLRFIRNAKHHWNDPKPVPRPKLIECKPQDYFLGIYPSLPMVVHKILRSSDWKEKEEFMKFFN